MSLSMVLKHSDTWRIVLGESLNTNAAATSTCFIIINCITTQTSGVTRVSNDQLKYNQSACTALTTMFNILTTTGTSKPHKQSQVFQIQGKVQPLRDH